MGGGGLGLPPLHPPPVTTTPPNSPTSPDLEAHEFALACLEPLNHETSFSPPITRYFLDSLAILEEMVDKGKRMATETSMVLVLAGKTTILDVLAEHPPLLSPIKDTDMEGEPFAALLDSLVEEAGLDKPPMLP
ncbi:hypothetical protein CJ030_MR2G023892 [Morella rubra]|uniref:Uncharacterized protein n=1 Tax=Morella rubra TaxID=262757 RepID=A0A6A1WE88_9ROSI|nr:hypothetical protein CJ030_MR2G023892 [Morella rubra]